MSDGTLAIDPGCAILPDGGQNVTAALLSPA